jgi:AmmeMemoRadiSam system protein A
MPYEYTLTDEEKKELLRIARATLKEFLMSGRTPPGAPHRKSLTAPAPVFVSLHDRDELRGCVGTTQDTTPVYKAIQEMAIAAASRDPRFQPVRLEELGLLTIEVSVLGPRAKMDAIEQIEVGKHGLHITGGPHKGLLLPKVAVDHGWDAVTFLDKTCEKAGLPPGDWKKDRTLVEMFPAQVFDEKTLRCGPFAAHVASY